jgi:hypothetical protein
MLIVLVIVFGVAGLFGLGAISKQLDGMENHLETFAHDLRGWIEAAANDIVKASERTSSETPYDGDW